MTGDQLVPPVGLAAPGAQAPGEILVPKVVLEPLVVLAAPDPQVSPHSG